MGENSAWLELVHTGGGPMAIELTVLERELDLDGEIIMGDMKTSTDFIVHPAQIILYPGERARAQVMFRGATTADRAYFLFSKETPLHLSEEGEGVRMGVITLMNYYTVLAVSTGRPGRLTFVSSRMIGSDTVEVIVENASNGRVQGTNLAIVIGDERITNFTGKKNSIMPGQRRRFTFRHPRPLSAGDIRFEHYASR
jgi:P pilus assembly chaperone PapD